MRYLFLLFLSLTVLAQTRSVINTGTNPNDGTGDTLRTFGIKVNTNFYQLWETVYTNGVAVRGGTNNLTTSWNLLGRTNTVDIALEELRRFEVTATDSSLTGIASLYLDGGTTTLRASTNLQFITPAVLGSTALLGDVLTVTDPTNGAVEFQTMSAALKAYVGDPALSVGTIADLIATTGNADYIVATKGYHTQGDGGHGLYRWTNALPAGVVTNRGSWFAGTTGFWSLVHDERVNVRQFGAKGDGVTDDSPSVGAALAAARHVSFPPGEFFLPSTVQIVHPGAIIAGEVGAQITTGITNFAAGVFYSTNITGVTVRGLRAKKNIAGVSYANLLRLDLTSSILIEDCVVEGIGLVISRGYLVPAFGGTEAALLAEFALIDPDRQRDWVIQNNVCVGDTNFVSDFYTWAISLRYVNNVVIHGNSIFNYHFGAWVGGGDRYFVAGGITYVTNPPPFYPVQYFKGKANRIRFSDNLAKNGRAPLWAYGCETVTFVGNVVEDVSDVGLDVEFCSKVSMSGNSVRNAKFGGLAVFDGSFDVSITGNTSIADDDGVALYGHVRPLTFDGSGLSTNIVVSGNTFAYYGTNLDNSGLVLGKARGGVDGFGFFGNIVKNVSFNGINDQSRNWHVRGNSFIFDKQITTTNSIVLLNYSSGTTMDVSGNTFSVYKDTSYFTTVDTSTDTITTIAAHGLTTGAKVRVYRNENGVAGITDGQAYWANVTTTTNLVLYDSEANAISGGATGKVDITSAVTLRWSTYPEIVPFGNNPAAAIELNNRTGNELPTRVYVAENVINGAIDVGLVAKARDVDYTGNETNFTGEFLRRFIFPCQITVARNTFDERIDRPAAVRAEQIGRNTRMHLDGNSTSIRGAWPRKLDNLHVATGTRLEILEPDGFVNYRTARTSGYVSNSTGGLAWVTATAYQVGDIVASDSRNYVCVVPGVSSSAPTGDGASFGIVADGDIRWAFLGGAQTAAFVGHDYLPSGRFRFNAGGEFNATDNGILIPRVTTAQRDAFTVTNDGQIVYNTTTDKLQVRAAGSWVDLH